MVKERIFTNENYPFEQRFKDKEHLIKISLDCLNFVRCTSGDYGTDYNGNDILQIAKNRIERLEKEYVMHPEDFLLEFSEFYDKVYEYEYLGAKKWYSEFITRYKKTYNGNYKY